MRKQHEQASKELAAARKRWLKLDPVRGNGGDVLNPLDADFRSRNRKALKALRDQLEKSAPEGADLPAGRHARTLLALLDA